MMNNSVKVRGNREGVLSLVNLISWLTFLCRDNLLYTLYSADKGAFAVDHRAVGYHLEQSTGK